MCFSSGKSSKVEPVPTPPEPEVVKRTEADVVRARSNAKDAATQRYGIAGTNVTQGALAAEPVETKRKTLGGA